VRSIHEATAVIWCVALENLVLDLLTTLKLKLSLSVNPLRALSKIMTFSSTGKADHRPALSLPLLSGLPDEDMDIEKATLCEHGDTREHEDDHDPNCYFGFLVLFFSHLQVLELGLTYHCAKQVQPFVAVVSGTSLFCAASIYYKLSILNNHAVLAPQGWMNLIFTTVYLVHLILSALFLLQLGSLTGWLDNAEHTPMLMSAVKGASLFCAASVLHKLSLKKNPVALVPELWITAVFATALFANAEIVFQVLMSGTIFMSLAAEILSSIAFSIR
jgi:hypothetical protein